MRNKCVFESSSESIDTKNARESQRLNKKIVKDCRRRTVFVGNLPSGISKRKLEKIFNRTIKSSNSFVESVRFRGVVSSSGGTGKMALKRAVIHNENAGVSKNRIAYILLSSVNGVAAALTLNGHWLPEKCDGLTEDNDKCSGCHIRVDSLTNNKKAISRNSVFLGNLPFNCNEEEVRQSMSVFGQVTNVRLIRDRQNGAVKGFGYLQFEDPSVISLALRASESVQIGSRMIRIQECKYDGDWRKGADDPKTTISKQKTSSWINEKQKHIDQKKMQKKLKRKVRRAQEYEGSKSVKKIK